MWKRERKISFIVKKPDKHYLIWMIEINTTMINHADNMYLWYYVMSTLSLWLSSQEHINHYHHERKKKITQTQLEDNLWTSWPVFLKTLKVIKNRKSKKLPQSRKAWGDMTTKCKVVSWIDFQEWT